MRVVSNTILVRFSRKHVGAETSLQQWRKIVESRIFSNFADVRSVFNSVDKVGQYHVFNVGGNKYRLVTFINFDRQVLYLQQVFTHGSTTNGNPNQYAAS